MKYLLWALVLYLAWRWFSAARAAPRGKDEAAAADGEVSGARTERMVKCLECGVHLPVSEALPGPGDQFFCSESHRDQQRAR